MLKSQVQRPVVILTRIGLGQVLLPLRSQFPALSAVKLNIPWDSRQLRNQLAGHTTGCFYFHFCCFVWSASFILIIHFLKCFATGPVTFTIKGFFLISVCSFLASKIKTTALLWFQCSGTTFLAPSEVTAAHTFKEGPKPEQCAGSHSRCNSGAVSKSEQWTVSRINIVQWSAIETIHHADECKYWSGLFSRTTFL